MRPYAYAFAILSIISGCYASNSPPREVISLKEDQRAQSEEIDRLRRQVVVLSAALEELRREVRALKAAVEGRRLQEQRYGRVLEEEPSPPEQDGTSTTAEVQTQGPTDPDALPVEELAPPAPEPKRVVLRLHGRSRGRARGRARRRLDTSTPFKEPPLPHEVDASMSTPAEMYEKAMTLFRKGRYQEAAEAFGALWRAHPRSDLADNALFWKGECFYRLGRYEKAREMYEKVLALYPRGNKAPDAMLKLALAIAKLGNKDKAREILNQLVSEYPGTEAARRAETVRERNLL